MCTRALSGQGKCACVNAARRRSRVHTFEMGTTAPASAQDSAYRQAVTQLLFDVARQYELDTDDKLASALNRSRTTALRYRSGEVRAPLSALLMLERTLADFKLSQHIRDLHDGKVGAGLKIQAAPTPSHAPANDVIDIPVISRVAAGRLADPSTQIEGDHPTIVIGGLEPGDYFATVVDGTSMNRISPHGSTIIVNRRDTELVRGRRYIFARRGKTTYKKWETNPDRLEPETTDPDANPTIYPQSDDEWTVVGRVRLTMLRDL